MQITGFKLFLLIMSAPVILTFAISGIVFISWHSWLTGLSLLIFATFCISTIILSIPEKKRIKYQSLLRQTHFHLGDAVNQSLWIGIIISLLLTGNRDNTWEQIAFMARNCMWITIALAANKSLGGLTQIFQIFLSQRELSR